LADLSHTVLREECIPASSRRAHADRFKRRPDICAAPAGSTDEPRLQEGERTVPALKLGEMAYLRVPQLLQGRHRELLLVIYSHREEPQRSHIHASPNDNTGFSCKPWAACCAKCA